ncbi:gamma-aminobutyric acid receptor subunit gamma-2-like [Dendronephthya gigantea]|uniref:gamma-aminobutyric acid receptor subunit gamma-2-like n=1 Tax=Dendronephthya gigantea TaxID=151771 RepID=UPI0010693224|nr:gamma-aminobutyric acid receptor subunit gamma-2-like [Dendronephthya gigantea]
MRERWSLSRVWRIIIWLHFVFDVSEMLVPPDQAYQSEVQKYVNEQTRVADELLKNYDKRFIPAKPGFPLNVTLNLVISDILNIENMEAEMLVYIRQTWYDYRLAWNSTKTLKIREHFLDKIWLPDVRISNLKEAKRFEGFGGTNMNIHPDGKVYYSQLAWIKTSCPMDLHKFPMDQQTCFLNFSSFAYSKTLLNYTANDGKHVSVRRAKLSQFDLIGTKEFEGNVPGVAISLTFQRRFGHYLMSIYIPSASVVVLSWLAFFMEPWNVADRLALQITMTLTIVFLLEGINKAITHVSYAKASDIFVIVSFGCVFLALLETMFVFRLSVLCRRKRDKNGSSTSSGCYQVQQTNDQAQSEEAQSENTKDDATIKCICTNSANWIDKICLIIFPTSYFTFNIVYWKYYTSAD